MKKEQVSKRRTARLPQRKAAKNLSDHGEVISGFQSVSVIRCTLRDRAVEFLYEEGEFGAPLLRDRRTGKRLRWKLTKNEKAALDAYITETPAQRNARLGW